MKKPLINIITVNYKQLKVTCELLGSISSLSYPHIETIVVDNAQSYDDSILYSHFLPEATVINSSENLGFAGANNLGIQKAGGDYIFLLNNDTEITDGTIEQLLGCFDQPAVGAVSPVLRYHSHPEKVQFAGFTEINPLTGRNLTLNEVQSADAIDHGAAVMIPSAVIDERGLMPAAYFLYYEELDWSRMIRNKGYSLKVCTKVSVMHKESVTTGKDSPLKTYYQTRNRVVFMNKYGNPLQRLSFNLFFHGVSLPFHMVRYAIRGQQKHLSALFRGFSHASIQKKAGMTF